MQDRSNSSAVYLDSSELVYDYTKYYVFYKVFTPGTRRVLVIGGGIYSIPKAFLTDIKDVRVDVAEIEPSLFELGKSYFRVKDDVRLRTYIEDGRRFLVDAKEPYDVIMSDVYYSLISIPAHFTTKEFFQLVYQKLSPSGIFIVNLPGQFRTSGKTFLFSEIKTLRQVFPNSYLFAVVSPSSLDLQNFIFVGYKARQVIDFRDKKFESNRDPIIKNAVKHFVDQSSLDLSNQLILTDDYSPVESLIGRYVSE